MSNFPWYTNNSSTSSNIASQTKSTYLNHEKINAFNDVGFFLQNYVNTGGEVTKNIQRNDTVDVTDISAALNNHTLYREGTSFLTTIPNTTYHLDFREDGDWWWGTGHPVGATYLTVAEVTTDSNGNVDTITDKADPRGGFRLKSEFGLEDYATKESVESQFTDIAVNVKSFGALGDGINDDYQAIQEAVNYANHIGGGVILLPPGAFKTSKMIDLKDHSLLIGAGRGATVIIPTFTNGIVIGSTTNTKQKPSIVDLSIISETYQHGLIGISFRFMQYADVRNTEIQNCGVAYDLDGTYGCYYNSIINARSVSCAYGVRTKHQSGQIPRANANLVRDITIISPIIGVLHDSGNSNLFDNVRVETLESYNPTPTIDPDGKNVPASDRWVLKITSGESSWFAHFRSEFAGNILSLGTTYGHFLRNFFCIYNGISGAYTALSETPTNPYQTNNFEDVQLGHSTPFVSLTYYTRRSRLGQMLQFPPQISMTPRDTVGAPSSGKKGLIRMDANADLWVATADDSFKKIFYDTVASSTQRGAVQFHKSSTTVEERTINAGTNTSIGISMSGMQTTDTVSISTNFRIPNGLIVHPPQISGTTVVIYVFNPTNAAIALPAGEWTASYTRA